MIRCRSRDDVGGTLLVPGHQDEDDIARTYPRRLRESEPPSCPPRQRHRRHQRCRGLGELAGSERPDASRCGPGTTRPARGGAPVVGAGLHPLGRPVTKSEVRRSPSAARSLTPAGSCPVNLWPQQPHAPVCPALAPSRPRSSPIRVHPDGAGSGGTASRRKPLTMSGRMRTVLFVDCPAQEGSRSA